MMVKPEVQLKPLESQGSTPATGLLGLLKYINSFTAEAVNQMQTKSWVFLFKAQNLGLWIPAENRDKPTFIFVFEKS